jgi:D-xylose transport system ATP-binding protein
MTGPRLELRGLYKSFGAVQVLHDVDLSVYPGEVTAMVGDNGAGKSTLVKCISGIYTAHSGEFRFDGRPVTIHNPRDAAALGIEVVYQDLALCDNLDIVANMFLGRERRRGLVLDDPTMEQMAAQTLAGLAVRTVKSVRQQVASLSGGQRQTVAIAKAVLWNSQLVILDEPTAALGVAQTAQVLELVRRLANNGLAVLLISHNMNDVFAVSDRIAALYLGRMVAGEDDRRVPLPGRRAHHGRPQRRARPARGRRADRPPVNPPRKLEFLTGVSRGSRSAGSARPAADRPGRRRPGSPPMPGTPGHHPASCPAAAARRTRRSR